MRGEIRRECNWGMIVSTGRVSVSLGSSPCPDPRGNLAQPSPVARRLAVRTSILRADIRGTRGLLSLDVAATPSAARWFSPSESDTGTEPALRFPKRWRSGARTKGVLLPSHRLRADQGNIRRPGHCPRSPQGAAGVTTTQPMRNLARMGFLPLSPPTACTLLRKPSSVATEARTSFGPGSPHARAILAVAIHAGNPPRHPCEQSAADLNRRSLLARRQTDQQFFQRAFGT